jgi:hypothetical protein
MRLKDMSPEERRAVVASSVAKLKAELEAPETRERLAKVFRDHWLELVLKLPAAEAGAVLVRSGYRSTSNKFRHASRIDREDWRDVMAGSHPGGMGWVAGLGVSAADQYRRCYTKDNLEGLPEEVFKVVRAAGSHGWGGLSEFVEREKV